jgi:hypothetical protein
VQNLIFCPRSLLGWHVLVQEGYVKVKI